MFKITGIYKLRHSKNKYRIYLEDESHFDVSELFVNKYDLKIDMELTQKEYDSLREEFAYQQAIYFIAYQPRTVCEVRRKLVKSGVDESVIELSVNRLIEEGYLDDRAYAADFVESKLKKYGRKKIVYDLMKRGVSKQVIDEALMDVSLDKQKETALECALKKLYQMESSNIDFYKKKQRIYAMLCRRGYDYEIIKDIMNRITQEAPEIYR